MANIGCAVRRTPAASGLDEKGASRTARKVSRTRIASRLANVPPCLIGIEAGMATHHIARELVALGHEVKHLRWVLAAYSAYYNKTRTHLSLDKDAPVSRAIQAVGRLFASPVLGGLHHQYVRI
jgi:hypothetical protein